MIRAEDTILIADEALAQTKIEEVVAKVLLVKKKIEDKPIDTWTLDGLVDHVFTLAKIMDNLSGIKDYMRLTMEAQEEEYKSGVRDHYLALKQGEDKITDGMAKALAEKENESSKQDHVVATYQYHVMNDLYKDCERLISFTQTKIKSMQDSSIRSNFSGI